MLESKLPPSLSVLIGSFNTHRLYPPPDINLSSWLTYKSHAPNIIAIGLQELPLTFSLFQQKSEDEWKKLIEKTLPKYCLLSRVRLNSLILFIYVQTSDINQYLSIATAAIPTGFMNLYGNKGSVGIRFEFNQTSLCFLNCHFSAGENPQALQQRNEQYSLIHQRMLFRSPCKQHQWNINDHHGIFLFGDLNYRQTETNEDESRTQTNILKTYSESQIKFPPTYKYHPNSDSYNISRRSSWTDRIFYQTKQCHIKSIDYWSPSTIRFSDHRPIANLFFLTRLIR